MREHQKTQTSTPHWYQGRSAHSFSSGNEFKTSCYHCINCSYLRCFTNWNSNNFCQPAELLIEFLAFMGLVRFSVCSVPSVCLGVDICPPLATSVACTPAGFRRITRVVLHISQRSCTRSITRLRKKAWQKYRFIHLTLLHVSWLYRGQCKRE
jgi:hypothetical protein